MKIALAVLFAVLVSVNGRSLLRKRQGGAEKAPKCHEEFEFFKKLDVHPYDFCGFGEDDRRREEGDVADEMCHRVDDCEKPVRKWCEQLADKLDANPSSADDEDFDNYEFCKFLFEGSDEDKSDEDESLEEVCEKHIDDLIDAADVLGCFENDYMKRKSGDDKPSKDEVCFWANECIYVLYPEAADKKRSYEYSDESSDSSDYSDYYYDDKRDWDSFSSEGESYEDSDSATDKRELSEDEIVAALKIAYEKAEEAGDDNIFDEACKEHGSALADYKGDCVKSRKRGDLDIGKDDVCYWGRKCFEMGKKGGKPKGGKARALAKALRALRTINKRK